MTDIDRQIAEQVMGYHLVEKPYWGEPVPFDYWRNDKDEDIETDGNYRPSEIIAQAFEVVEKMIEKGFYFECHNLKKLYVWGATFSLNGAADWDSATDDNLPMAICLAALKATGDQDG